MCERTGSKTETERDRFFHIGTITAGLVSCDVYSELGGDLTTKLSQLSANEILPKQNPFAFRFQRSSIIENNLPKKSLFLVNSREMTVSFDPTSGFLIEAPLDDPDFQQRIPYLVYAMTERVRQQELSIVTVHAAAVSKENHGLLILGDKGAGKTSLLLSLGIDCGYKIIGNDLVLLQDGSPLTLFAGLPSIDIRDSIVDKFQKLQDLKKPKNPELGPYERKTHVYPQDVEIMVETNPVPVCAVVRVNLHDSNPQTVCSAKIPTTTELLRLNENFSRYIRGLTTPVEIKDGKIQGYYPSFDTKELCEMRNRMINQLLNGIPYYYVLGNNPSEIAEKIEQLLSK